MNVKGKIRRESAGPPPDILFHAPPAVMGKRLTKKSDQVLLPCFHLSAVSFQPYTMRFALCAMVQGTANFFMGDPELWMLI